MSTDNEQNNEQQDILEQQESTAVPSERVDISASDLGDPDAEGGNDAGNDDKVDDANNADADAAAAAQQTDDDAKKDPVRREADGLKGDLIDTRKDLRAAKERIAELERAESERQAAARAAQSRDYDAELAALDEQYDNGDIEDFKTYQQGREKIVADKASEAAVKASDERRVKEVQEQAAKSWTESVDAFLGDEANAEFREDEILASALAVAIQSEAAKGITDHATILWNARDAVLSRFGKSPSGSDDPQAAKREQRGKDQAKVAANGAAQVPSPSTAGGAGMRSQRGNDELSASTASKSWTNMSKAQQDEALGKPA